MAARMGVLRFTVKSLIVLILCLFAAQAQNDSLQTLPFKSTQAKLLVLGSEADGDVLKPLLSLLESRRLAYEHKIAGQDSLTWSDLAQDDEGLYRGVILSSAHLTDPETRLSALSPDEWALLQRYEHEYRARRLVLSFDPNLTVEDYGVRFAYAVDTSRASLSLASTEEAQKRLGIRTSSTLNLQDVYVSLLRLEPELGQLVMPLLIDSSGHAAAVLSVTEDGRERLLLSMSHMQHSSNQLLHATLAWVARQAPAAGSLASERSWWQEYRVVIVLLSIALLALFITFINWYRQQRALRALLLKPAQREEPASKQKPLSQLK